MPPDEWIDLQRRWELFLAEHEEYKAECDKLKTSHSRPQREGRIEDSEAPHAGRAASLSASVGYVQSPALLAALKGAFDQGAGSR